MAMYIMKGLCVIGIILNVVLMYRKNKELRAKTEKDPVIGLNGEDVEIHLLRDVVDVLERVTSLTHSVSVLSHHHQQLSK